MTGIREPGRHPNVSFFITGEHSCSYLPDQAARTVFADPQAGMDGETYDVLLQQGFRRSGSYVYRPSCDACRACVPLRIPVRDFAPNRSQRRNSGRNGQDVRLRERPPRFHLEHYALYRAYVLSRHADGSMAEATPESYRDFLVAPWGGETRLWELRIGERLMAVAVTDLLPHGLSAVYTFFDPRLAARAPGIYAVLCQIEAARQQGLDWLYLGYWVEECRKMSYKDLYRPVEAWLGERWRRFDRGEPIAWREFAGIPA